MGAEFKECVTCAAKLGSPTLCSSCLHNRELISKLADEIEALKNDIKKIATLTIGEALLAWRYKRSAGTEAKTIEGALHYYADHVPLDTKGPHQIQEDLRAILGEPHIHKRSIGNDSCDLCGRDLRDPVHQRD